MVSKRNLLFQGAIFRFHVKLWEGKSRKTDVAGKGISTLGPLRKVVSGTWALRKLAILEKLNHQYQNEDLTN